MHGQFNPTSRRVCVFTDRVATRSAGLMTGEIGVAGVSAARAPPHLADDGRASRRGVIRVECAESRLDRRGGRVAVGELVAGDHFAAHPYARKGAWDEKAIPAAQLPGGFKFSADQKQRSLRASCHNDAARLRLVAGAAGAVGGDADIIAGPQDVDEGGGGFAAEATA